MLIRIDYFSLMKTSAVDDEAGDSSSEILQYGMVGLEIRVISFHGHPCTNKSKVTRRPKIK